MCLDFDLILTLQEHQTTAQVVAGTPLEQLEMVARGLEPQVVSRPGVSASVVPALDQPSREWMDTVTEAAGGLWEEPTQQKDLLVQVNTLNTNKCKQSQSI